MTSREWRGCFSTSLDHMLKPVALKFHDGDLYVGQSQTGSNGDNSIFVYERPFSSGMAASREIGRVEFQDEEPQDPTNWTSRKCGEVTKWIHLTSGIVDIRGFAFDKESPTRLWANDPTNNRVVSLDPSTGDFDNVIGQSDINSRGCGGVNHRSYHDCHGIARNICDPEGEIGVDNNGELIFSPADSPYMVARFDLPLEFGIGDTILDSDGCLLYSPIDRGNKVSGKTLGSPYGMVTYKFQCPPGQGCITMDFRTQLFVADGQRILVWNDFEGTMPQTFDSADYVLGQSSLDENYTSGGIFSGYNINNLTAGANKLFASVGSRIFVFNLPITATNKNPTPYAVISPAGIGSSANVYWTDDRGIGATKVDFSSTGIYYQQLSLGGDAQINALWISDISMNRVLRITNPTSTSAFYVDLVLGQNCKTCGDDNAGLGGPNQRGFASPWSIMADKENNLYVTDSHYEYGCNGRVMRFAYEDTHPHNGVIFPFPNAAGVYAKPAWDSSCIIKNGGDHTPGTPTYVAFDSNNRMLLLADSYNNSQYERAFLYNPGHEHEEFPIPENIIDIPFGQAAIASFYPDNNHILIQDHTWNRVFTIEINK